MVSNIAAPSGTNVPDRELNTPSRPGDRPGAEAPADAAPDAQAPGPAQGAGRVDVDQAREAYAREARAAPANPLSSPAEAQETASAVKALLVGAPDAAMQAQAGAGLAGAGDLLRTS